MRIASCTIIANNYHKYAELLAKSYKKHHPDHEFYTLFLDNKCKKSKYYTAVALKDLNIPNIDDLLFKYNILEMSTAVKPFLLEWIIEKGDLDQAYYYDPDIYIFKKLNHLIDILKTKEAVLVPHITDPAKDNKSPNEWDFMMSGYYNLGFVGFKVNKNTKRFIKWWQAKLSKYCFSDPTNFMFTDQKWMDFAPSYLDTHIVKKKGFDVAYWNLHEYIGKVPVDDITFFHYSGFKPERKSISKYQDRFTYYNTKEYQKFFEFYDKELLKLPAVNKKYKYPFDYFSNGVKITNQIRRIYKFITTNHSDLKFSKTFSINNKSSFYNFLKSKHKDYTHIINLFYYMYQVQPDISSNFPNVVFSTPDEELANYISWCINFSSSEYDTPLEFIDSQKRLIKKNNSNLIKSPVKTFKKDKNIILKIENLRLISENDAIFVRRLYRLILNRNVDKNGIENNLKALRNNQSKSLIIYRLLSSSEYTSSNKKSLRITIYKLFLLLGIVVFKVKNLILPNKAINNSQQLNIELTDQDNHLSGINVSGYLDTESGVGESARGMISALDTTNLSVSLTNIEQKWLRRGFKKLSNRFSKENTLPINLISVNADQVENTIVSILGENYVKNKYNIGYWYWETDIFPDEYKKAFETFNEIWVATNYVYDVLRIDSPKPIVKIPPSFKPKKITGVFNYKKHGLNISKDDFVFLNIFDSGSFWQRKNPFGLIKAFAKAFPNNKKVKLIIKTTKIKESDIYKKLLTYTKKSNNILFLDGYLDKQELDRLQASSDAYISLHRSEGLGMPLIESMLMGKPTIATSYGGNTDFMNINNSFLVKHKKFKLEEDIGPYKKGSTWAEADLQSAIEQMKFVEKNRNQSIKIAKIGKEDVTRQFSPENIGDLIEKRIKKINKYHL